MAHARRESCRTGPPEHSDLRDSWRLVSLSSCDETRPLIEDVTAAMTRLGYSQHDVFGMRLALEEALVNSIKHGHGYDPTKHVRVRYSINESRALLEIEDEGEGFDPHDLPDPTAIENQDRPCGRGVLLMRAYLSWLRYGDRGNSVTLCKYPSASVFPIDTKREGR
jgi:serine/threonine-protein kinase RsbW